MGSLMTYPPTLISMCGSIFTLKNTDHLYCMRLKLLNTTLHWCITKVWITISKCGDFLRKHGEFVVKRVDS